MADFNKALLNSIPQCPALVNRGRARFARGDYDGAIIDYDRAIEVDPQQTLVVAACRHAGNDLKELLPTSAGPLLWMLTLLRVIGAATSASSRTISMARLPTSTKRQS
jgi:tetratricopeptide (TPR) repeat protein